MRIPIGISNRHVHLSQADANTLFGPNYELTKLKDLSQPGQYACEECVTIKGAKGAIEKVRILGPYRTFSPSYKTKTGPGATARGGSGKRIEISGFSFLKISQATGGFGR
ncbi:MAG: hypothetical protein DLD55_03040 [candidate division SR1 bacterium]|nr:MAG: hypothetical protein DLD55_03040 [candidate division SR1 bacterium]